MLEFKFCLNFKIFQSILKVFLTFEMRKNGLNRFSALNNLDIGPKITQIGHLGPQKHHYELLFRFSRKN